MNNSLLLRAAMALCAVNALFALLSTWSMSSARTRLNEGLQQADRAVAEVAAKAAAETAAETTARKDAVAAAEQRLQAAEKEIGELRARVFPPAPQPRRPTIPSGEPGAAPEESGTPPVNLKP
jgi:uncharacterized protein involved in exopolysaccharide biosynthesis